MRPRRHVVATIAATLVVLIAPTGRLSGIANADDKVVLGGGAGIVVDGNYCTLATIGHDHADELIGFTAGHCGGPGAPVVAEGSENHGPVGTVAAVGDGLDYGVIKFDPAKVTPTANFAGFAVNGIGGDPSFREPVCTQGAATGNDCGRIISISGPGPRCSMPAPFQPGDDGRPVTAEGLLIGLTYEGYVLPADLRGNPAHPETHVVKFSAILADVNTKGGPGAGFSPIPA
jgi:hypothetical protein